MNRMLPLPVALAAALGFGACSEAPQLLDPGDAALQLTAGSPKFSDFMADEAICVFEFGQVREVDGALHFQGMHVETEARAEDPRYRGVATVELRGHRDLATGLGTGFGRFTFQPDEMDGTWEGTFTGKWTPGWTGRGVARGTGELRGQTLHVEQLEVIVDAEDRLCDQPPAMAGPPVQFLNTVRVIDPRP